MIKRREQTVDIDKYLPIYYAGASGDFNLIHIDSTFAQEQGLEANILQGLCTLGIAAGFLIGNGDPSALKSINMRFVNPVLPGDKLTFAVEGTEGKVQFSAVNQHGEAVLADCAAELY